MRKDYDISWLVAIVLVIGFIVAFLDITIWRP
jgi:uncharacterized membrane protein YciS (DUF1049 family)